MLTHISTICVAATVPRSLSMLHVIHMHPQVDSHAHISKEPATHHTYTHTCRQVYMHTCPCSSCTCVSLQQCLGAWATWCCRHHSIGRRYTEHSRIWGFGECCSNSLLKQLLLLSHEDTAQVLIGWTLPALVAASTMQPCAALHITYAWCTLLLAEMSVLREWGNDDVLLLNVHRCPLSAWWRRREQQY